MGLEGAKKIRVKATRKFLPNFEEGFNWYLYQSKKWQVFFSQSQTDRKTYSGQSVPMTLKLNDMPGYNGWWNVGKLSTVGVIAIVALLLVIIISSIVLGTTKACKKCREKGVANDGAEEDMEATNMEIGATVEPTNRRLGGSRRFNRA